MSQLSQVIRFASGLPATGRRKRRNATTIRGPLRLPVTAGPAPARAGTAGTPP